MLGICVGMQVLFQESEESPGAPGLGWIEGKVVRLPDGVMIPQMGWNSLYIKHRVEIFDGISEGDMFYFVHSYAARSWDLVTNDRTAPPLVTWADHGGDRFVAAVENGPLWATQFHPEKSGDAGAALLRNWVAGL